MVGRALALGGFGICVGLAAGLLLTRLLGSMLYGVSATDPAVFAGSSLFLLGVAAVAGYLPGHRAARTDPVVPLRHE